MLLMKNWQKSANRRLFFNEEPARMGLRDWLIVLAVTAIYAFVAFSNLGSTEIPKTYYTMNTQDETITVKFTAPQTIDYVKFYTALGDGDLSFSYSQDGKEYSPIQVKSTSSANDYNGSPSATISDLKAEHTAISMYQWQFLTPIEFTAQYVSIQVDTPGMQMLEMGFCGSDGKAVSIESVTTDNTDAMPGNPARNMFDEQQYVPVQTYYMTEMYFDEVYHARTALEYLEHVTPYEITHPPLGKTIITLGIQMFGMDPFGWRFMGTLFGVFLLPLMYYLAKKLFKKPLFAFIPTFLFAVDFMHFSQTRIATIDSYSAFFVMLTWLFMYLYSERNYNKQPLIKTLLPLALSGVFFGIGASAKWLCLYSGAGLMIFLGLQFYKRYKEFAYVRLALSEQSQIEAMDPEKLEYFEYINRNYVRKTFITFIWCVLFFVAVPLVTYYFSYTPYMAQPTDGFGIALRVFFLVFAATVIIFLTAVRIAIIRRDRKAAKAVKEVSAETVNEAPEEDAEEASAENAVIPASSEAEETETRAEAMEKRSKAKPSGLKSGTKIILTIVLCVLVLAIALSFMYYSCFSLYTAAEHKPYNFAAVLNNQDYMFNYHAYLKVTTPHPFESRWWSWPLDIRPVFLFQGKGYPSDYMSSLSTMGNPAVWWGALASVIALVILRIRKGKLGKRTLFLGIAAASQFLPWLIITRETFIYHYFETVPFLILLMAVLAKYLIERTKHGKTWVFIFMGVCLLLFILFYPVTTGIVIPRSYANVIRWLPSWPFY